MSSDARGLPLGLCVLSLLRRDGFDMKEVQKAFITGNRTSALFKHKFQIFQNI